MNVIEREEFNELINYKANCCISIVMPTHQSGVAVNQKQDSLVFKNILQEIANQLSSKGLNAQNIDRLLAPAFQLHRDETFWNNQLEGLVVFLADDMMKYFQLPYSVNEEFHLGDTFNASSLIPAITNNEDYYVLVLSKHDAQFYQGDGFGLQKMEVEGLPNGMDDVIHFEEKEGKQLFRQGAKGGTGSANFHGHGEGRSADKDHIATYFQEVDRTLFSEVLHDKNLPLLLVGTGYLLPIYKGVSKYKHIVDEVVMGNHDAEDEKSLFKKAKTILSVYFKEDMARSLSNYYNQIATPATTSMPDKIVLASKYAQVATLYVCRNAHVWGTFNEAEQKVVIHQDRQAGDECLLNLAVVNTLSAGGNVYCLEAEQMPKGATMAAILRF